LMFGLSETLANDLLNEGLFALQEQCQVNPRSVKSKDAGNYLISLDQRHLYIGEAKSLSSRLVQQFTPITSTFYKTFQNSEEYSYRPITEFSVQVAPTRFGRKELEDFGISNLNTRLNKFQLGKRTSIGRAARSNRWHEVQTQADEFVRRGADDCMMANWIDIEEAIKIAKPGIYIVRHKDEGIIYVGESSDVGVRLKTHSSATYFSAFRRNLATTRLGHELETRKGKKRYLAEVAEGAVNAYMRNCKFAAVPLFIGRYEIEENLIAALNPVLNRKSRTSKVNRTLISV
jgi:predicted GIY-YIG superfamily endonuclease